MSKITISFDTDNLTAASVRNAVRRAFETPDLDLSEGVTGTAKGVTYRVKQSPKGSAPASGEAATIRAWAVSEGVTVGKRGRLAPDVVAAYNAAH